MFIGILQSKGSGETGRDGRVNQTGQGNQYRVSLASGVPPLIHAVNETKCFADHITSSKMIGVANLQQFEYGQEKLENPHALHGVTIETGLSSKTGENRTRAPVMLR